MREIKFRLFDKRDKKMIYPDIEDLDIFELSFIGDSWQVKFDNSENEPKYYGKETFEIMQFTGLLDKRGKEIYEGDIIEFQDMRLPKYEVKFQQGSFCIEMDKRFKALAFWHNSWIEVIGNVYEHSELLNKGGRNE